VQFEGPEAATARLRAAEVPIVKAQVSAALRVPAGGDPAALAAFAEPRFLHQTRERVAGGGVVGVDDLDEALAGGLPGDGGEWRAHFHVPVHWEGPQTTQAELVRTLDVLVGGPHPLATHLDVETYTWTVLPPQRRPDGPEGLVDGLACELRWVQDRLCDLGLKETS
jgi:hypothetical protein